MFTFNGFHTSDLGLVVNKIAPFYRPRKKTNVFVPDGSSIAKIEELGYQPYELTYQVTLLDDSKFELCQSVLQGQGTLVRDDDNTKYHMARIDSEIEWLRFSQGVALKVAEVTFFVYDPFRYLSNEPDVVLTSHGNIENNGTVYSEPLIKMTGIGIVILTINGFDYTYDFDTPFVYLDSSAREAYASAANIEGTRKTRRLTSDFNRKYQTYWPVLEVGTNVISWTGTITELVITKRSRYL